MRVHLVAIGTRAPSWVDAGWQDYERRLGRDLRLSLHPVAPARRGAGPAEVAREDECARIRRAIPAGCLTVALDGGGEPWTTRQWCERVRGWMLEGRDIALLVGGADGLAPACLQAADHRVSLSPLTFPHALVRVIVAEQVYRVWSLLRNHPYHR